MGDVVSLAGHRAKARHNDLACRFPELIAGVDWTAVFGLGLGKVSGFEIDAARWRQLGPVDRGRYVVWLDMGEKAGRRYLEHFAEISDAHALIDLVQAHAAVPLADETGDPRDPAQPS